VSQDLGLYFMSCRPPTFCKMSFLLLLLMRKQNILFELNVKLGYVIVYTDASRNEISSTTFYVNSNYQIYSKSNRQVSETNRAN
jgi:hypothetical protein